VTVQHRLRRARALLVASVAVRAVLAGASAVALGVVAAAAADWAVGLSREVRVVARALAWLLGFAVAAALAWRGRRARALPAVALWLEERLPSLRYSLVTLLELRNGPATELEQHVARVSWRPALAPAVRHAVAGPALAVAAGALLLLLLPPGVVARVRDPRPGDALGRPLRADGAPVNHLDPLVATVRPPPYARAAVRTIEQPASIAALVGSAITLEGRGADARVEARLEARSGGGPLAAMAAADRWSVSLDMPPRPAAVVLRDGEFERLVALEPRRDSAPSVTLALPARDTVFRVPRGNVALRAEMRDDIGLAASWFEYIVSSGEGESFTFRSGVVSRTGMSGRHTAELRASISLEALRLDAGDVLHLRAVARDANDVGGPGVGVSETRTLRMARQGEYDSVAVEGAPPPDPNRSELSQRMLIILAESLERRRPRLARQSVVAESRRIGTDQTRLRRRVGEIIFSRLGAEPSGEHSHEEEERGDSLTPEELLRRAEEATGHGMGEVLDFKGDESPVVAINRPLLEAYNAMWDAGRELGVGEPGRALPHMRAALAAIQRARQAERYYLRGSAPVAVVDVEKVRLSGKGDDVAIAHRRPRSPVENRAVTRAARFAAALRGLGSGSSGPTLRATVDSLLVLRLDEVESSPALAAALAEAIDALRAGRDATAPLARARQAIIGEPAVRDTLPRWGAAW
jgi:hypothetical protein